LIDRIQSAGKAAAKIAGVCCPCAAGLTAKGIGALVIIKAHEAVIEEAIMHPAEPIYKEVQSVIRFFILQAVKSSGNSDKGSYTRRHNTTAGYSYKMVTV
jgi:hypothetical protein